MSNLDIIGMALRSLFKRKMRTFLTVLGVTVGTCAIIIISSLIIGMNKNYVESLSQMGDLLTVNVYKPYNNGGYYSGSGSVMIASDSSSSPNKGEVLLDDKAIEDFKKLPGVLTATAFVDIYSIKAISGKVQNWLQIRGIDPESMELLGYTPKEGTLFTGTEKFEAVFGYNVPFDFYNPKDRYRTWEYWWPGSGEEDKRVPSLDIFEDKIQFSYDYNFGEKNVFRDENYKPVKPFTLNVVGWLPYNGNTDYYVLMPIDDVLKIKADQEKWQNSNNYRQWGGTGSKNKNAQGYENAIVKFTDLKYVEEGLNSIRTMGYNANGMIESLRSMQEITASLQVLLGAIGGVALFVAALGISNTMIMSIYERTKEIGVMKVIGATLKDIKRLFLLEAAMIGFLGGIFGIGISLLGSVIINKVGIPFFDQMNYGMATSGISSVPLWLCGVGIAGATVMGTLSGFFPARRAMKLSALSAIRTE